MVTLKEDTTLEKDARFGTCSRELIRVYRLRDYQAVCCYDVTAAQCHALEYLAKSGR